MRVSADALGFEISFAVEPRCCPARPTTALGLVARLPARLARVLRRVAEPRLEDLRADQLADVGLPPDWRARWQGPSGCVDLARRSMVPF
jgi:hypothetical protein